MTPVEVSVTCANSEEAALIGEALLTKRLVACTQMWPIKSRYWWNGEIVDDNEQVLLAKTAQDRFEEIVTVVTSLHSYDLPAITMNVIEGCNQGYREWIHQSISG